jgi:chorismate synthase
LENTKTIRREIAEMDLAGFTWKPMDATEFDVIVAWASSGAVDGDYGRNLQAIATAGIVTNRTLGTAVSLVPTWKREQLRDMERKAAARVPSTWVEGELKQRVTLTLTLKNVAVYPNDFGYSYVHRFLTPDGKRVVWSASREQDLTIGQTIVAQASIKAKEVDQYGPVTKVLRLTIKETVSAA